MQPYPERILAAIQSAWAWVGAQGDIAWAAVARPLRRALARSSSGALAYRSRWLVPTGGAPVGKTP